MSLIFSQDFYFLTWRTTKGFLHFLGARGVTQESVVEKMVLKNTKNKCVTQCSAKLRGILK